MDESLEVGTEGEQDAIAGQSPAGIRPEDEFSRKSKGLGPERQRRFMARFNHPSFGGRLLPIVCTAKQFGKFIGKDEEWVARLCMMGILVTAARKAREHWAIFTVPSLAILGIRVEVEWVESPIEPPDDDDLGD